MILKKCWSVFVVKLVAKLSSQLSAEEKVRLLGVSIIGFQTYRVEWSPYYDR